MSGEGGRARGVKVVGVSADLTAYARRSDRVRPPC
ncbi:hypothetical protein QFZ24_007408 [Streptomyces phaeochromogenes]|nr:hypothetical protein [Streptomyces phaeochromogenes]